MFGINWKSRTTWTGFTAILAAVAGYFTGDVTIPGMIAAILAGAAVVFGRAAIPAVKAAAPLLIIALLAGCGTLGQQQGQGAQEINLAAGHARARFKMAEQSEGNRDSGTASIPLVYRETKDGPVKPVLMPDGSAVITKVTGSGIVIYVNSEVTNSAESTIAGTVEGSEQKGDAKGGGADGNTLDGGGLK